MIRFIAEVILLINDGSSRVQWVYDQRRGEVREYAIMVRIEEAA
ncbi:MAG TPA: hypothetical protein VK504_11530 [Vicinamibacterales bacterium]|nr:hypothetical protein [Vicinamibacterales bacterium]